MEGIEDSIEDIAPRARAEPVSVKELPGDLLLPRLTWEPLLDLPLREAKRGFEKEYIVELMTRTRGNITRAAQLAGIARQNLHQKLRSYGIRGKEFK